MNKVLLIIKNQTLRQLYHERLVNNGYEIMATSSITNACLILTLSSFNLILICLDNEERVYTFLRLRSRRRKWLKIPLILLIPEPNTFQTSLTYKDQVIDSLHTTPTEVIAQIESVLKTKKRTNVN